MRFFLAFLTAFMPMFNTAYAQQAVGKVVEGTQFPGISYSRNFVKNPDAERNILNMTNSASIVTRTTTSPLAGTASFAIDGTSGSQTVKWDTSTLEIILSYGNCEAKFSYNGDASLYKAYVEQGSTKVTVDQQLLNMSTGTQAVSINFPCGDLASNSHLVIETTSASAAAIKVDNVYLGGSTNISSVAQPKNAVMAYWTGSQTLTHAGQVKLTFAGGATFTNLLNFTHSNGTLTATVAGDYKYTCNWELNWASSASVPRHYHTAVYKNGSELTRTSSLGGIAYNAVEDQDIGTAATATTRLAVGDTLECYMYQSNGNGNSYSVEKANINVEYFPNSSQQVVTLSTPPSVGSWTTCTGAGAWSGGNVTYTCKYRRIGENMEAIMQATLGGTPTGAGSNFTFTVPNGETIDTAKLSNTTGGLEILGQGVFLDSGTAYYPLNAAYNSTTTVSMMTNNAASTYLVGTGSVNHTANTPVTMASGDAVIAHFTVPIVGWSSPTTNVPIITGSISSNASAAYRTEHAYFTNAGSCAVSSQSGTWVTSVSDPGVGQCGVVWASTTWSAAPWCHCTAVAGGGASICSMLGATTTTGVTVFEQSPAAGGTSTDSPFYLTCTGPR